jgi:hypothetical protein
MDKIKSFAVAFGIGLSLGTLTVFVARAEIAPPKVFSGVPFGKGQWKMEILSSPHQAEMAKAGMSSVSICMDAAQQMAKTNPMVQSRVEKAQDRCTTRVLKDSASQAQMETTCPEGRTLATITKQAPRVLLMNTIYTPNKGKPETSNSRMSYEGRCAADSALVKADKNSKMCKDMKSQLAGMNPNMCASLEGQGRAMCEQQLGPALKQMKAMCGGN